MRQASESTSLSLQFSTEDAAAAQCSAPPSDPANSAFLLVLARPFGPAYRGCPVLTGVGRRCDLLDVLETEQHLLLGKRFCLPAKAMTSIFAPA